MNIFGTVWNAIVAALAWMLQVIYDLVGNYGIAIILLTILVKLLLLPLTIKQTRSMLAMQRIQPEIKKLQEKYKDDREKLSQEMMKFYKENKINPLAGCLPLLMQMPIFIALYTVLRKYVMTPPIMLLGNVVKTGFTSNVYNSGAVLVQGSLIRDASFLGINNLSDSLRVCGVAGYVLVILLMATTWYSQKQVVTDPRQKNIMMIMPLVMGFIGFTLPAGVVLYWVTTNALQILQQYGIQWWEKKEEARAAEEAARLKEEARRTGKKLPEKEKGEEKPAGKAVEKTKEQEAQRALPGKKKPAQPDKQGAGKPDKPAQGQPKGSKQSGDGKPQSGGGQGGKGGGAPKGKPLPKQPPGGRRKPPPRKK
jgi:YidC/Oxa1 family membrane protein insertase